MKERWLVCDEKPSMMFWNVGHTEKNSYTSKYYYVLHKSYNTVRARHVSYLDKTSHMKLRVSMSPVSVTKQTSIDGYGLDFDSWTNRSLTVYIEICSNHMFILIRRSNKPFVNGSYFMRHVSLNPLRSHIHTWLSLF